MQGTRKILVSNLPQSIHEDYLELFFENTKQYGGGPVANVILNKEKLTAIVEFETPDAVEKVLSKGNIRIMNQSVQVQKYNTEDLPIIEVKGPPIIVCEDNVEVLQLYFEHAKNKGGKVQTIKFDRDRNSAIITFESKEVAERVLQHNHILKQQSIQVQKFDPWPIMSIEKRIRVKGVKDFGSEDALRFYFENKRRSGGGSIADIQFFHETNEAVITFENMADATSVLEKEHIFNNKHLEVARYIAAESRPCYTDRLLIRGVKSTTSDESLANFIEAKLGTRVKHLAYHKDRDDVVLVFLHTSFDLTESRGKIKSCSFDGAELQVYDVQVTDCIVVENLPDIASKDTVGLYFDNAQRSGGGNVKKTDMSADNRTCVVYFDDYSVVDNVVAQEHILSGEKLLVDRYLECLCLSEKDALDTSVPSSVVLYSNNHSIQSFVSRSKVFEQKLEKELKHIRARLERHEAENQTLVVFTPRKGVVSNKFQRHWKEKVLRTIAMEEAGIQVHHKHVSDTDTQKILEHLSGKERNSDNVCISFDQTKGIVSIVGFTGYTDLTIRFIDAVTDVRVNFMNTNEENVSDSLTISNRLEMNMLQKLGVPDELEEKYPKLKVFFNKTEGTISFDGSQNDIRDAKLHVLETKLSLTCVDCRLSESAMKLFSTEETKEFIGGKLKKVNTFCEWRVQNQRLSVCCFGNSDANMIADMILHSVKERSLSLKPEVVLISMSEMWSNIDRELQERYSGRFVMHICDKTRVQLYSTEDISSDIYADLQKLVEMEETRHIDEVQHASEELESLSDMYLAEKESVYMDEDLYWYRNSTEKVKDEVQHASEELESLSDMYLSEESVYMDEDLYWYRNPTEKVKYEVQHASEELASLSDMYLSEESVYMDEKLHWYRNPTEKINDLISELDERN